MRTCQLFVPIASLLMLVNGTLRAADTTPPTLDIPQTWIEKVGSVYHFKMYLDPQDDTGVDKIEFRTALNTTNPLPVTAPWSQHPWTRGEAFDEPFVCTSIVIEIRAKDAAGNASPLQRRTFKSPFPLSTAPNLEPMFAEPPLNLISTDPPADCKGLFTADFDGLGRDDILQIDNASGLVKVRRHSPYGDFVTDSFQLTAGTIQDSAIGDFDHDGRMDIAMVVNNDVVVYHNNGLDVNGTLTFTAITPPGRTGSAIATVDHLAVADVNGDGRPDIIIVGTVDDGAGGTLLKMEVLANSGNGSLATFNTTTGPAGGSTGRIAVGDVNGDGIPDVVMVDKTASRLVIFKGMGNGGAFGGSDDPDPAQQPLLVATYFPGEAIAIGDIAGTGHNDVVITQHYYGTLPDPYNDGQSYNAQFWQYFAHDADAGLVAYPPEYLAVGPASATATAFNSDVLIRDFTGDRFPEIVMTSEFDAGIRAVRMTVPLDNQNKLNDGYTATPSVFATSHHPQRLAIGDFGASTKGDLVVANGDMNQISLLFNTYTTRSKDNDLIGGAGTDSDPNGTPDVSGNLTYSVCPNEQINYSLTYLNNTDTAIAGATVACVVPFALRFVTASTGYARTFSTSLPYTVSWTVDIPAHSSGVVSLTTYESATTPGTVFAPTASLKKGSTVLASTTLPKVTVKEPLVFSLAVSSDSDPLGATAYPGEAIKYNLSVTNLSTTPVGNVKMGTAFPAGTSYLIAATPETGTTYLTRGAASKETGIDWTVPYLPPNGTTSEFVLVNVTAAANASITESTATCTRATTKITAPSFKTTVVEPLVFSFKTSTDSNSAGDTTHTGEAVQYTFTVTNRTGAAITNVKMGTAFPIGTTYFTAPIPPLGTSYKLRGTSGKETGIDWTIASLPAHGVASEFVLLNVVATITAQVPVPFFTENTATASCALGSAIVIAPAFKTTVLPALSVVLSADKTIARPGDYINYIFTVENWGVNPINNAKLVDVLPQGMALTSVHTDGGDGNFIAASLNGDNITATTNPGIDRTHSPTPLLTWTWTSMPGKSQHTAQFTCQVQYDAPTFYYVGKVSTTNLVSNLEYNFVGTPPGGGRLFAATAVGGSAASSATAVSSLLLSTSVSRITANLSGGDPLAPPNLALQKDALNDAPLAADRKHIDVVINDPNNASDGVMWYGLTVSNGPGAGTATAVQVHDFVPTGTNLIGFVSRDGTPVPSYFGFHFYDAGGKEIPGGGELLTKDVNGDSKWETGDTFIDANGNKKWDGIAAIRSFTFPAGDLAGGQSTVFSYKVQTTLLPGATIVSNSGGLSGKVSLYSFDPVAGYCLTASNLNFPVNGSPRQLQTLVTAPASFDFPAQVILSRSELIGDQIAAIGIPFTVRGGQGLTLSAIKIDIPIPKGYRVVQEVDVIPGYKGAVLLNSQGAVIANPLPSTANSVGVRTLSFPVGTQPSAEVLFLIALDPATKSVLKDASGEVKAPLSITATATGKYLQPGTASTLLNITTASTLGVLPVLDVDATGVAAINGRPAGAGNTVVKDAHTALTAAGKDSKIFVGRYAPAVVRRGQPFTYTIIVGNLTSVQLGFGTITMNIPAGTTYASATNYLYNVALPGGGGTDDSNLPSRTSSSTPTVSGGKITWKTGAILGSEAGVVTVTVNVPDTFQGDRIDDNTCIFNVVNACGKSPGPLGVTVASGNDAAQASTATQAAIGGFGLEGDRVDIRTHLESVGFSVNGNSYNVTLGGCDFVHLMNDVVLIPLTEDRMVIIGPSGKVNASAFRVRQDDGKMRVAIGPGTFGVNSNGIPGMGVDVSTLPGLTAVPLVTPNSIIIGLGGAPGNLLSGLVAAGAGNLVAQGGGNLVAAGAGNLVAGGGGNLVAAGAGNLIGNDGSSLIGTNAARILLPEGNASLLATDVGGHLVAQGGGNLVAGGGGNLVASGGGNLVAAGAGNLVAGGGGNLITNDGAGLVAAGAGNLVAQGGGNLVAAGAGNLVSAGAGNFVSTNGSTAVSP